MPTKPFVTSEYFDYGAQAKERHTRCNLCGFDSFVTIAHRDRYGFPVRVDGCRACGLAFLNPHMTRLGYSRFYAGPYRAIVEARGCPPIGSEHMLAYQARYADDLAELITPHMKRVGTMLDVGGSTGVVSHRIANGFGFASVTVIDPAESEIQAAATLPSSRRYSLKTVCAFAEDYEPDAGAYDLVTVCQTVDHFLDIKGALSMCRRAIRSEGLLFVDIVDFEAEVAATKSVSAAVKLDHPYYLTASTLQAYLIVCGFSIVAMDYARDGRHIGVLCSPIKPQAFADHGLYGDGFFGRLRGRR